MDCAPAVLVILHFDLLLVLLLQAVVEVASAVVLLLLELLPVLAISLFHLLASLGRGKPLLLHRLLSKLLFLFFTFRPSLLVDGLHDIFALLVLEVSEFGQAFFFFLRK